MITVDPAAGGFLFRALNARMACKPSDLLKVLYATITYATLFSSSRKVVLVAGCSIALASVFVWSSPRDCTRCPGAEVEEYRDQLGFPSDQVYGQQRAEVCVVHADNSDSVTGASA